MQYFNDVFMKRRREQWLRSIAAVEVATDGQLYRGEINQKKVDGDTVVIMATFPVLDPLECTIVSVRLVDVYGATVAHQPKNIKKKSGQGTMIKVSIPIYEVTA